MSIDGLQFASEMVPAILVDTFIVTIVLGLLAYVGLCLALVRWEESPRSMDDLHVALRSDTKHCDITNLHVRREVGSDDTYLFGLDGYDVEFSLSKADYELVVGLESNSVKTNIYEVKIIAPQKGFFKYNYSRAGVVTLRRFSFIGQELFSNNEIISIGEVVLRHLNSNPWAEGRDVFPTQTELDFVLNSTVDIDCSTLHSSGSVVDDAIPIRSILSKVKTRRKICITRLKGDEVWKES